MLNYPLFRLYPDLKEKIERIELRKQDHLEEIAKAEKILEKVNVDPSALEIQKLYLEAKGGDKQLMASEEMQRQFWNFTQKELIESKKNMLAKIEQNVYAAYGEAIELLSHKKPLSFVYFFLKDEDFENFKTNFFDNLSEVQYKRLTGTRAYYNVLLKDIQVQASIPTNLTSHIARHSYSQLLLDSDASLSDISNSLGHMHISTTQTYISKLPSKNIAKINSLLSDKFSNS